MKRIVEVLKAHPEWTWSSKYDAVGCEGCDWTKPLYWNDKAADVFREHQAKMIAEIVIDEPKAIAPTKYEGRQGPIETPKDLFF